MSKKEKLAPNPNHTAAGKIDYKNKNTATEAKVGGQKGTFVGVPDAIHIHIVSNKTHLITGTVRTDFDPKKKAEVQNAIDVLKSKGSGKPGAKECQTWLTKALAKAK